MLGGVRQLLLDLLHHLPEGWPVEGVSVPAGPHDLVPAAEGQQKNIWALAQVQVKGCIFVLSTFILLCFDLFCFFSSAQVKTNAGTHISLGANSGASIL